jgi:uncharacterized protein (TIGR03085 family)
MGTVAAAERAALCDLLLELGPDAPTLSGEWTTRDLAAHLVVRERRPDAGPGIVTSALAGYSERVRLGEAERPFPEIVERVRRGPPRWNPMRVAAIDRLANTIEFFVHHEDVRRAQPGWTTRALARDLEATLVSLLPRFGKMLVRKADVGITVSPAGEPTFTLKDSDPTADVAGPIGECVLYFYGRSSVAAVDITGPGDAVRTLQATAFGI